MWEPLIRIFGIFPSYFDLQLSVVDFQLKWRRIWKWEKSNKSVGHDTRFSNFFRGNNRISAEILLKTVIFTQISDSQRNSAIFENIWRVFNIFLNFNKISKSQRKSADFWYFFHEKMWILTMSGVKISILKLLPKFTIFSLNLARFRIRLDFQAYFKFSAEMRWF